MDAAVLKRCFKCGVEQPRSEFYAHPQMGDGLLGKCKRCTRRDTMEHRLENLEKIRAYDRKRAELPHRVEGRKRRSLEWRRRFPDRRKAQHVVNNRLRDKKIEKPERCQGCSRAAVVEAHHHDYSKPLAVVWLCKPCHAIADKLRRVLESA